MREGSYVVGVTNGGGGIVGGVNVVDTNEL
jgi:hypothetical protein